MRKNKIFTICLFLLLCVGLISTTIVLSPFPLQIDCEGFIKDAGTGLGINDATVRLWVYDFITGWQYIGKIDTAPHPVTGEDGYYKFPNIPMGAKQVRVSKSGYHTYYGVHLDIIELDTFTYDYIFYGTIKDEYTSQALSGATAEITCGGTTKTDTTDNSGFYHIEFSYSSSGVRAFDMEVTKTGHSTYTATITRNYGYEERDVNLNLIKTWIYIIDYDDEGDGGDTYIKYEMREYERSTDYKIIFDIYLEHYYYYTTGFTIKIDRYNPYGNMWYDEWIGNDDATVDPLENGQFKRSLHVVEEFYYDKPTYYESYIGVRGGLIDAPGDSFPHFGGEIVFQLGKTDYGSPFDYYSTWYGWYPYGFFGILDEDASWLITANYPSSAWYSKASGSSW